MPSPDDRRPGWPRRLTLVLLGVNAFLVFGSLLGSWALFTAGLPVPDWDYNLFSTLLAMANMVTASAVAGLDLWQTQGRRTALIFCGVAILVAGGMELLGTTTGLPFGRYEYSSKLGPKFLGHVPYLIPLTWFMMLYPSMVLALRLRLPRWATVIAAGLLFCLWDLAMDPAVSMPAAGYTGTWPSGGYAYWAWQQVGTWYGMPLQNWAGWLATAGAVSALVLWLAPPWKPTPIGIPFALYTVQSLFVAVLTALIGRPGAGLTWLGLYVLVLVTLLARRQRRPASA